MSFTGGNIEKSVANPPARGKGDSKLLILWSSTFSLIRGYWKTLGWGFTAIYLWKTLRVQYRYIQYRRRRSAHMTCCLPSSTTYCTSQHTYITSSSPIKSNPARAHFHPSTIPSLSRGPHLLISNPNQHLSSLRNSLTTFHYLKPSRLIPKKEERKKVCSMLAS
jgi:hypothetical protein